MISTRESGEIIVYIGEKCKYRVKKGGNEIITLIY